MKTKNILSGLVMLTCLTLSIAQGAKVSIEPIFFEERFQPSDKFHAECTNSADVLFSPQGQKITNAKIVLSYNPEALEILRILPVQPLENVSSKIEYNKIILNIASPKFTSLTETKAFFKIYFKSSTPGRQLLSLATWSEATTSTKNIALSWSFPVEFVTVPECEPDIVPPSINLIYPKNSEERIYLDQYFIFDIKDIGKGIDKESVVVRFDKQDYRYGSDVFRWNGNYLTFYPQHWIPIDSPLTLSISISDKQSYGWANTSDSVYDFLSATGMMLQKNINPNIFRKIAQEAEKISASADECILLWDLYMRSERSYQQELYWVIKKLWCSLSGLETLIGETKAEKQATMTATQKHYRNVSVFGSVGWILFFVTFTLKLHYLYAYKKHKKTTQDKRIPKTNW